MKLIAIVQARLGSTRLPRKSLADLDGGLLLDHAVERAWAIKGVQLVVLAVPHADADTFAVSLDAESVLVGFPDVAERDVLGRFARVAAEWPADAYIRLTGDCPLLAPDVADLVVGRFLEERADYASNDTLISGWPDGTDVEVFTHELLMRAHLEATSATDREHVTPIMKRLQGVRQVMLRASENYSAEKWSVDTEADLAYVRAILAQKPKGFSFAETWKAARRVPR